MIKFLKLSKIPGFKCSCNNVSWWLKIAVRPHVSLYPGPVYVAEGSNVTLPACHVEIRRTDSPGEESHFGRDIDYQGSKNRR